MNNRIAELLDRCSDFDGPLSDEVKQKFWTFFLNPTKETWHEIQAQTFMFWGGGMSPKLVWTELVRRHPQYARMLGRGKGAAGWVEVPDVFIIYRVMEEVTRTALGGALLDKTR